MQYPSRVACEAFFVILHLWLSLVDSVAQVSLVKAFKLLTNEVSGL